MRKKHSNKSKI
jgi:hypothetical protein